MESKEAGVVVPEVCADGVGAITTVRGFGPQETEQSGDKSFLPGVELQKTGGGGGSMSEVTDNS